MPKRKPSAPNDAPAVAVHCRHDRLADPATLQFNPGNDNKHPDDQLHRIVTVFREIGIRHPVIVSRRSGMVVVGEGRSRAAMLIPGCLVPVVDQDFASEAEELAFLLADNKIADLAERDDTATAALIERIKSSQATFTLAATGYADREIKRMLDSMNPRDTSDSEPDINHAAELLKKWGVQQGDIFSIGDHRLMCGDCADGEYLSKLFDGDSADLIVTSPPYNQGIDKFKPSGMHKEGQWVEKVGALAYPDSIPEPEYQISQIDAINHWADHLKSGGSMFYNHKNRFRNKSMISPLAWLMQSPLSIRQEIVWSRPGSVTQNARMFLPSDERIFWMYKGDDFYFDDSTEIKTWSTVWDIRLETNLDHAVAFPTELPRRCILACSRPSEIVFEPYTGSGTTMVAAQNLSRRCYGMEISPGYCAVTLERMATAFPGIPINRITK